MSVRGALSAVAAAALALAPAAQAHWSKVSTVAGAKVAAGPVLASNDRGDVLMAWNDVNGATRVAFAHGGGPFARARRIPGPHVETYPGEISVAIGPDRTAVVAWQDCIERFADEDEDCRWVVWAAARVPGHKWARSRIVSDTSVDAFPDAVAAGRRRATVTYEDGDTVYAARSGPRGSVRRARPIAGGRSPAVGISRRGVETFVWASDAGIRERRRFPSGRLTRIRLISRSFVHGYPVFAFGASASVAGIWDNEMPQSVTAGVSPPGHRMRERTFDRGNGGSFAYNLAGAPDSSFAAAFVRQRFGPAARHQLRASRSTGGRGFTRGRNIRGAHTDSTPSVAATRGGFALITWLGLSGRSVGVAAARSGESFIRSRTFRLAHKTDPSCEPASDLCDLPVVALDGRGHGYLAWPDRLRLRVARYAVPHRVSIARHP